MQIYHSKFWKKGKNKTKYMYIWQQSNIYPANLSLDYPYGPELLQTIGKGREKNVWLKTLLDANKMIS